MNGTQFEFVILKHKTLHPHYDLILETGDGLKSWILLKEPPVGEDERRLAIEDEVYGIDFSFSGDIVEDGYGTGRAEIWDKGIYKIREKNRSKIIFGAEGEKFFGKFIILLPEWGRWSRKRLWVLTKY